MEYLFYYSLTRNRFNKQIYGIKNYFKVSKHC